MEEFSSFRKKSFIFPRNKVKYLKEHRKEAIKFDNLIGFIAYHKQEALKLAYKETKSREQNSIRNIGIILKKIMNGSKKKLAHLI